MNRPTLFALALLLALASFAQPAFAVEGREVQLRSSTQAAVPIGAVGVLDTTPTDNLVFRSPAAGPLAIPYAGIVEFSYQSVVAHRLGVLGTVAVGLVKRRERKHLISITFRDENQAVQVVSFEVSKGLPDELLNVLRGRARTACERKEYNGCVAVVPRTPVRPSQPQAGAGATGPLPSA
jgi:hypothetical protein